MNHELYWNAEYETIEPEALRLRQLEILQRQLAHVRSRSPFYRDKWANAGFDPGSVLHGLCGGRHGRRACASR
jgi:phenylacetate-coenzyme A ligase PaaK-like adenylate-forming protein